MSPNLGPFMPRESRMMDDVCVFRKPSKGDRVGDLTVFVILPRTGLTSRIRNNHSTRLCSRLMTTRFRPRFSPSDVAIARR
jgi:hypothetical protein